MMNIVSMKYPLIYNIIQSNSGNLCECNQLNFNFENNLTFPQNDIINIHWNLPHNIL